MLAAEYIVRKISRDYYHSNKKTFLYNSIIEGNISNKNISKVCNGYEKIDLLIILEAISSSKSQDNKYTTEKTAELKESATQNNIGILTFGSLDDEIITVKNIDAQCFDFIDKSINKTARKYMDIFFSFCPIGIIAADKSKSYIARFDKNEAFVDKMTF